MTVLLGTALMGSFATLVADRHRPVSATDRETLFIMGAVVGGWGALIVLFAVVSTVGITVTPARGRDRPAPHRRRHPAPGGRLVRAETLLVAVVAAAARRRCSPRLGGRALLALLRDGDVVADSVRVRAAVSAPGRHRACSSCWSACSAAGIAGRRATRGPATLAPSEGRTGRGRLPWWRVVGRACCWSATALGMGVVTITVTAHDDDPYAAMQTSGSCAILVGARPRRARARGCCAHLSVLARPARSAPASPATSRRTTPAAGRTCSAACWHR